MFPFSIVNIPQTDSTNTYLEELLFKSDFLEEYLVLSTENQLNGKGQGKNRWYSSACQNVQFSLLLKPAFLLASQQFRLNMMVSIAIVSSLKELFPSEEVSIKWPNDIYIGNRKIAGVLIKLFVQKAKIDHAIIGVGLNVNEMNFPKDIPNPISMLQLSGKEYSIEAIQEKVLSALLLEYKQLPSTSFVMLKNKYLSLLYRYKQKHFYSYKEEKIEAKIVDISNYGQLMLQKKNKDLLVCNMGEVCFLI